MNAEPFKKLLVADRSSSGWQQVMEGRYYLYPIHTTCTFLSPTSLSSALYLAVLYLLQHNYEHAFKLIEGCCIDTEFTEEEKWVFSQFQKANYDRHPDAHACRLKLILAIMYSPHPSPWPTHKEMTKYLQKLPHVSAQCTLSLEGKKQPI